MTTVRPLIAANFKMNERPFSIDWSTGDRPHTAYHSREEVDVVVFPSFLDIEDCVRFGLVVGAQCGHAEERGAHTGDVSMAMLSKRDVLYVLCGHSERRAEHGDTDAMVAAQAASALAHGLIPIVCVGETMDERKAGATEDVLARQMSTLAASEELIVAYEPVWAIGTERTPTTEDIARAHAFIRSQKTPEIARVIYGGSVNATNAAAILTTEGVDGVLVGGASLKPKEFSRIVEAAIR